MTPGEEDDLICEKLLGWQRGKIGARIGWGDLKNNVFLDTAPSFRDWNGAGLILDALNVNWRSLALNLGQESCRLIVEHAFGGIVFGDGPTGPLAIRAAALEYLKNVG